MRKIVSFFFFLSLEKFSYTQDSASKKVTFIYGNSPPYYITEGPFKHQGVGDYLLTAIVKELPHYSFSEVEGSSLRIKEELKKKSKTICTAISGVRLCCLIQKKNKVFV